MRRLPQGRPGDGTTRTAPLRRTLAPALAATVLGLVLSAPSFADGPDLRTVKMPDVPTWISVPFPPDQSLVLKLSERFWIQAPRHSVVTPTGLETDGIVLTFVNARGGSHSMLYAGVVPLPEPVEVTKLEVRLENAARDFVTDLRAKLLQVDYTLKEGRVTVEPSTVALNGKKQLAWRTSKFMTTPTLSKGPDANFGGEILFFGVGAPGKEALAYVGLTSKSGGTTLDRGVLEYAVKPTSEVARTPRHVQLNDIFLSQDPNLWPVRWISYESPAGFAPTLAAVRLRIELIYAEDRVEADGVVSGTLRFDQDDADSTLTLARATEYVRKSTEWGKPGPAAEVPLATEGAKAAVFSYTGSVEGRAYSARMAVALLGDKVLRLSWATFGDAARFEQDGAAFDRMLRSMRLAIRSAGR